MSFYSSKHLIFIFLIFLHQGITCSSVQRIKEKRDNTNTTFTIDYKSFLKQNNTNKKISTSKYHKSNGSNYLSLPVSGKTWQVSRVSRKQYEIINMLWRKTKIFLDVESTTAINVSHQYVENSAFHSARKLVTPIPQNKAQEPSQFSIPGSRILHTPTPSYIEFYYFDENEHKSYPEIIERSSKEKSRSANMSGAVRPPIITFHVNGGYKHSRRQPIFQTSRDSKKYFTNFKKSRSNTIIQSLLNESSDTHFTVSNLFLEKNMKLSLKSNTKLKNDKTKSTHSIEHENKTRSETPSPFTTSQKTKTTAFDKIKFFEIYDTNTQELDSPKTVTLSKTDILYETNNVLNVDKKILLHNVDFHLHTDRLDEGYNNNTRFAKKHIIKIKENNSTILKDNPLKAETKSMNVPKIERESFFKQNISQPVAWDDYPFIALYVYEPFQVRCDTAAISTHWLIGAGSCLSRHRKDTKTGQSAFVAYCSGDWRQPGRIAYVKYTIIHPSFHPRDRTRRHLYNIGVIQVINSMAHTCNGWSPISLMSHQFTADPEGSLATAIGWGLDRYVSTYYGNDFPKGTLTKYEEMVHSEICPGNVEYSKEKRMAVPSMKNVYCLTLPPYSEEESDPVHGSLLLIGGKLLGLYLQEERRPWGYQSAQYTGVWRLVPWIHDVAVESEELDAFSIY